jgi:hypothetical protein
VEPTSGWRDASWFENGVRCTPSTYCVCIKNRTQGTLGTQDLPLPTERGQGRLVRSPRP